jgi:hypothetical protein
MFLQLLDTIHAHTHKRGACTVGVQMGRSAKTGLWSVVAYLPTLAGDGNALLLESTGMSGA